MVCQTVSAAWPCRAPRRTRHRPSGVHQLDGLVRALLQLVDVPEQQPRALMRLVVGHQPQDHERGRARAKGGQ